MLFRFLRAIIVLVDADSKRKVHFFFMLLTRYVQPGVISDGHSSLFQSFLRILAYEYRCRCLSIKPIHMPAHQELSSVTG